MDVNARRGGPSPLRVAGWTFALVVALLIAAFGAVLWRTQVRLARLGAKLVEDGAKTTLAELEAAYPVPAAETNAASLYTRAAAELTLGPARRGYPWPGLEAPMPPAGSPWPGHLVERIRRLLELNGEVVALLQEAAALERCCYGPGRLQAAWPPPPPMRSFVKLMATAAAYHLQTGAPEQALRATLTALALGPSARSSPFSGFSLLMQVVDPVALSAVDRLMGACVLDDAQLATLDRGLARAWDPADAVRAADTEVMRALAALDDPPAGSSARQRFMRVSGLWRVEQACRLEEAAALWTAARLPVEERPSALRANAAPESWLADFLANDVRRCAAVRCWRTAVAVERHARRQGAYPDTLGALGADLLPATPTDPFDGQPLTYAREQRGFVVYSVGGDGADDAGDEKLDVCARVLRPAAAVTGE